MPDIREGLLTKKRELYSALLEVPNKLMTENEVDIMYLLSKDSQIQSFLTESINLNPDNGYVDNEDGDEGCVPPSSKKSKYNDESDY
jgi:hypothetical protein